MGRLEESTVDNSIVNIKPYHLLSVKALAKFVLCCAHGSPVSKSRKTLSGQHQHCRVCSHKTMPTVTPTVEFKNGEKKKKKILKMSGQICCGSSVLGRTAEQGRVTQRLCVTESTHIGKSSGFTHGGMEGECESGRVHCRLTGPTNVIHHYEDDANKHSGLSAEGG